MVQICCKTQDECDFSFCWLKKNLSHAKQEIFRAYVTSQTCHEFENIIFLIRGKNTLWTMYDVDSIPSSTESFLNLGINPGISRWQVLAVQSGSPESIWQVFIWLQLTASVSACFWRFVVDMRKYSIFLGHPPLFESHSPLQAGSSPLTLTLNKEGAKHMKMPEVNQRELCSERKLSLPLSHWDQWSTPH